VLHTHNPIPHYYGVLAAIGLGVGCILNTRHGMGMFPFSWKRELLYRLAMFGSDYGVAVCRAAQVNFRQKGIIPAGKGRCIPNGIELDSFAQRTSTAKNQLLANLGRAGVPLVFGIVGRLNAAKDHACLLQAMASLVKQHKDVHLVIVGDGECRSELEDKTASLGLAQVVTFLGRRGDVSHLLMAFDVFVLSSRTEGYSLALVEAAATALPIVATNVGGNGEIVTDGVTGLLVPKEDPRALCDAMLRLACDEPLRVKMGLAAQEWAQRVGSLDAMAKAYERLYSRQ
jgi:glycosyltransferase involved in cell wall biosynthesis